MKGRIRASIFVSLLAFPSLADAITELDLHDLGPTGIGAAAATTSIADGSSAFNLNPAGLSRHSERRFFDVHSKFFQKRPKENWSVGGSVIDGKTEDPLHWGFRFNSVHTERIKRDTYDLALSFNFKNIVLAGISNQLSDFDRALETPERWTYSMNAGLLLFATDFLSVGAAMSNLLRSTRAATIEPVKGRLGLSFNWIWFRVAADWERDFSHKTNEGRTSLELNPIDMMKFRAGYYRNFTTKAHGLGLCTSVAVFDRLSLDFSLLDAFNSSLRVFTGGLRVEI